MLGNRCRWGTIVPILCWLLVAAGCGSAPERPLPAEASDRPDMILVSVDTLRPDHLGAYGHTRDTSPFLDAMAADGVRFEDCWSPAPWTLPSHATMLSGVLPTRHGAIDQEQAIDSTVPWLAESLQREGYRTAAFTSALYVSGRYGFARGFDHFDDAGTAMAQEAQAPDASERLEAALRWAEAQPAGQPLFVFVHLFDVHYPYNPPAPHDEVFGRRSLPEELPYENYFHYLRHPLDAMALEQQRQQYDAEIRYVDGELGRFWETWVASRPGAITTLTSDHGEEFGERGSWGHAHTLYPEQLRVPWITWGKGIRARRASARVGLEDLAPTLAGLAGVDYQATGQNRAAFLWGGEAPVATSDGPGRFASTSRFSTLKLRWHGAPHDLILDLRAPSRELYDLTLDPGAHRSVDDRITMRTLQLALFEWLGQPWAARVDIEVQTDGALVRGGRLLGPRATFAAGDSFALFPPDAILQLVGDSGKFGALGGQLPPEGHPLVFTGEAVASQAPPLSEVQRERLRALGYID